MRIVRGKTSNPRNEKLEYEVADFDKWSGPAGAYDLVVFSRVLHDLPHPKKALLKANRLLKRRGKLVCLEFAYDMIDRRTAEWLYLIRKPLELLGWYSPPHLPDDPKAGIDHILHEAVTGRKEHINTFEEMIRPLKRWFRQEILSWYPYNYWDILADMRIPNPRIEDRFATMVRNMEEFMLRTGEIRSVLFLYKGTKTIQA